MTRPARLPTARQAELAAAIAPAPESAELRRARRHKAAIEEFWRERGYAVEVTLLPVSVRDGHSAQQRLIFAITSNTRNGQPTGGAR